MRNYFKIILKIKFNVIQLKFIQLKLIQLQLIQLKSDKCRYDFFKNLKYLKNLLELI